MFSIVILIYQFKRDSFLIIFEEGSLLETKKTCLRTETVNVRDQKSYGIL
jgi:uncharacterized protein YdeI (YjbR/CyaY-like superfamily)